MMIFPNLEVALPTKGHLMRNSASNIIHSKKPLTFCLKITISRFADCMIPNFEWVKNATGQNLCDALKAISNCKTAHPKCQNEYVGLAYGIANVSI